MYIITYLMLTQSSIPQDKGLELWGLLSQLLSNKEQKGGLNIVILMFKDNNLCMRIQILMKSITNFHTSTGTFGLMFKESFNNWDLKMGKQTMIFLFLEKT